MHGDSTRIFLQDVHAKIDELSLEICRDILLSIGLQTSIGALVPWHDKSLKWDKWFSNICQ